RRVQRPEEPADVPCARAQVGAPAHVLGSGVDPRLRILVQHDPDRDAGGRTEDRSGRKRLDDAFVVVGVQDAPAGQSAARQGQCLVPHAIERDRVRPAPQARILGVRLGSSGFLRHTPEELSNHAHCWGSRRKTTVTFAVTSSVPGSMGVAATALAIATSAWNAYTGRSNPPAVVTARTGPS